MYTIRTFEVANNLREASTIQAMPGAEISTEHGAATAEAFRRAEEAPDVVPVVIPAYNEEADLPATLMALARSERAVIPIVVDNGSSDYTSDIAEQMGARLITMAEPSKVAATAKGITYAATELEAEIIACTDADAVPPKHWAGTMQSRLQSMSPDAPGAMLFGGVLLRNGGSPSVDALRTLRFAALGVRYRLKQQPCMAQGSNYGLRLDAEGDILDVVNGMNPNVFRGDDAALRDAIMAKRIPVVGSLALSMMTVAKGDRITSLRELLTGGRAAKNESYDRQYPGFETYAGLKQD